MQEHPDISPSPSPHHRPRLAVLIDAENVSGHRANQLMQLVKERGRPVVCRAYGDWTTDNLLSWKKWLHALGIRPVQQFHYAGGKNASDTALIMDAMELLHRRRLDAYCIVSSDSDFVGLVGRIQEFGPTVVGFGQEGASPAFMAACDEFVCLHNTGAQRADVNQGEQKPQ